MTAPFQTKVVIVEDESFIRNLVADGLRAEGMDVLAVASVLEAVTLLQRCEPNVVICDLHFGSGPDGSELLNMIHHKKPWIGLVVMTAHASPQLAIRMGGSIPDSAVYLRKSDVGSITEITAAIVASIAEAETVKPALTSPADLDVEMIYVEPAQGEILKLLSEGLSNAAIARTRGKSLRATESIIQRIFQALNLMPDPDTNPRVLAVRLWQEGKVAVK
jgi:DNA-binding NarL/FixJ family response regulator